MKNVTSSIAKGTLVMVLMFGLVTPILAASTPSLGNAGSFGVLSSTYTNIAAGTINGDLGYTTPPFTPTTVNGSIFSPKPPQAGLDQGAALVNLNGQACTFTFASGAVDLASDTTHGTIGVYEPGVYCAPAAMSIGTTGITLSGAGTFIFRSLGALNTVANSSVTLVASASACDVFWTPVATTLGANSSFIGTVIDDAGITVGSTVSWIGRALSFATTVTTNNATITVPTCSITVPSNGGNGGGSMLSRDVCPNGDYSPSYYDSECGIAPLTGSVVLTGSITTGSILINSGVSELTGVTTPIVIPTPVSIIPKFPKTGLTDETNTTPWNLIIIGSIFVILSTTLILTLKKRTV